MSCRLFNSYQQTIRLKVIYEGDLALNNQQGLMSKLNKPTLNPILTQFYTTLLWFAHW